MEKELTREETQKHLLYQAALCFPEDTYQAYKKYFETLTDYDFWQFVEQMKSMNQNEEFSLKKYLSLSEQVSEMFGTNAENTARKNLPVKFLDEKRNDELLELIHRTNPSDIVNLTRNSDKAIIDLWTSANKKFRDDYISVPSDLFFAQTIPLMDCEIVVDETDEPGGQAIKYRVVVFENYKDNIDIPNSPILVGAIVTKEGPIFPKYIVKGGDSIAGQSLIGYKKTISQQQREYLSRKINLADMQQGMIQFLSTWYGIQIALLHPVVNEIFRRPKTAVVNKSDVDDKHYSKHKRRKVRYVKEHIIKYEDIDDILYETPTDNANAKKRRLRKSLVWYVIGHWREYESGKKIFVKPYWKGELREIKRAIPDRDREIPQAENGNHDSQTKQK